MGMVEFGLSDFLVPVGFTNPLSSRRSSTPGTWVIGLNSSRIRKVPDATA